MNLADIRNAIKTALGSTDLRVYAFVPDNPVLPCVIVYPENIQYTDTYDGKNEMTLVLWCLAGWVDAASAQTKLDGWLGDTGQQSLVSALDGTLGGTVDSVKSTEMRKYGVFALTEGGAQALGAEIVLDILA